MSLKFKRNYPVLLGLIIAVAIFSLALGNLRVVAYTTRSATKTSAASKIAYNYINKIALLDDSVVHDIQVVMDEDEYDEMITTYQEAGLKEYFHADVIIDGVRVSNVGIRLKGNASLQTALGGRGGMGGNRMGQANMPAEGERLTPPEGFEPPENGNPPVDGERPAPPADGEVPGPPEGFKPPENQWMPQGTAPNGFEQTATGAVKIPFLIKFDEYEEGQTYQGYSAIAIRNYGISYSEAMLEEPVTNDMVRLVGMPATQTAYTGFQMNDEEERLYVISEIIDEEYLAKHFENANGVLYKAEVGSTLSYQGEEPSAYARSFSQETRVNDADLAPLIAFMRYLDQADEATFENELPNYLDIDSFAAYLAVNNLLVNLDSIFGMNNNYYLYYDDVEQRFTLLMWDGNESMGGLGHNINFDLFFTNTQANGGFGRGPGGGFGGQNVLVERFMANETFNALYEQKLKEIYQQVFQSGALIKDVERYSTLIHSVNDERGLVDLGDYDQAVQEMLEFINQRMEYLDSTELLG